MINFENLLTKIFKICYQINFLVKKHFQRKRDSLFPNGINPFLAAVEERNKRKQNISELKENLTLNQSRGTSQLSSSVKKLAGSTLEMRTPVS